MSLLAAEDLTVRFGGTEALSGVSLAIEPGEIVTILGPNGSGKTTLLRALLGIVRPGGGRVVRAPGLRIGYVPQKLAVDRAMPMTARRFLSLPRRVPDAAALAALARVGLEGLAGRQMSALSGGQFQRLLLARALLVKPQLLILDEPTQGLDQPGEAAFYRLIEEVRRETGAAVLMVSHDLHVVMAASDRVICLNHHVCCAGTPRVVSNAPEYRALFGLGTQGALALYQHVHDHSHDAPETGGAGQAGHGHTHHGHADQGHADHGHGPAHTPHAHAHAGGHGHAPDHAHAPHDHIPSHQPGGSGHA